MTDTTRRKTAISSLASSVTIATLSAVVALYYFGPQITSASFWLIDDHQVWSFLDRINSTGDNYFRALLDSAAYDLDAGVRARPLYRIVRMAEIFVWQDRPAAWYAFRTILYACICGFVALGVRKLAGLRIAIASIAAVLMLTQIAGSFTRLGAAEAYGLLGMALAFFALAHIATAEPDWRGARPWTVAVLNIGIMIAIGSKENFLPVFGLSAITFFLLASGRTRHWLPVGSLLFMLAIAAPVGYFLVQTMRAGHIAYFASDVNSGSAMTRVLSAVGGLAPMTLVPLGLTIVGCVLWALRGRFWNAILLGGVGLTLYSTIVFQPAFYPDGWPVEPASNIYNAVGYFAGLLLVLFASSELFRWTSNVHETRWLVPLLKGGILVVAITVCLFVRSGASEAVSENVARTARTRESLDALVGAIKLVQPEYIVFEAETPFGAYEPTSSTLRWLHHREVRTPKFLRLSFAHGETGKSAELASRLRQISDDGAWGLTPFARKPASGICISIFFQAAGRGTECTPVIVQY